VSVAAQLPPPTQIEKHLQINFGPQHPSTHGVLRLKVVLDGEIVERVEPVIGYLHRGSEKLAEDGTYLQWIPYTDRLDYLAAMHNNWAWVQAAEKLLGTKIPDRGEALRVIAAELNRIASHQVWLGTFGLDIGALTPFFWCLHDREIVLGLLEEMCGARLTYSYFRFGGVRRDVGQEFLLRARRYVAYQKGRIEEYNNLLRDNDIFLLRTQGVGRLPLSLAKEYGVTGPAARASGLDWDQRRDEPYGMYDRLDFDVPTRPDGDCFARYDVRIEEMRQSCRILEQVLETVPEGPYVAPEIGERAKQNRVKPPKGEVYARIEGARGEYGVLLLSDGTNKPYRVKWRAPTFSNLSVLPAIAPGLKIPDLIATLGSIDIVLGDIDR